MLIVGSAWRSWTVTRCRPTHAPALPFTHTKRYRPASSLIPLDDHRSAGKPSGWKTMPAPATGLPGLLALPAYRFAPLSIRLSGGSPCTIKRLYGGFIGLW